MLWRSDSNYVVMAYIFVAYSVMAYVVMACIAMAYIATACIVGPAPLLRRSVVVEVQRLVRLGLDHPGQPSQRQLHIGHCRSVPISYYSRFFGDFRGMPKANAEV